MSGEEGNSRSERLRQRRSARQEEISEADELSQADEPSKQDEPSKPSKHPENVKDELVGTYMYLPESVKKDLNRQYQLLKAEYEYEFDEEFEKNRHFYPLVVSFGLERLDGSEASDLQEMLANL